MSLTSDDSNGSEEEDYSSDFDLDTELADQPVPCIGQMIATIQIEGNVNAPAYQAFVEYIDQIAQPANDIVGLAFSNILVSTGVNLGLLILLLVFVFIIILVVFLEVSGYLGFGAAIIILVIALGVLALFYLLIYRYFIETSYQLLLFFQTSLVDSVLCVFNVILRDIIYLFSCF
jgi:hypothetical protein